MINNMISNLTEFSKKSFKNYSTPKDFFKNNNIIFGYNGRGKSSLSEGIVESAISEGQSMDSIRFFNRDYVKRNLLLNDTSSAIKGVKVSFSEKDAEIAREIADIRENIIDTNELELKTQNQRKQLRIIIDEIHNAKKGSANIKRKNMNLSIEQLLTNYNNDLNEALKIKNSETYIRDFVPDNERLENNKKFVEETIYPQFFIKKIDQDKIDKFLQIMNTQYTLSDDIPTSEIIKWLEKGISLHDDTEQKCKFCNGELNLQVIKDKVKRYKENSKQQDIVYLEDFKGMLKNNINIVETDLKLIGNIANFSFKKEQISELSEIQSIKHLEKLVEQIEYKLSYMEESIIVKDYFSEFENEVGEKANTIKEVRSSKIDELNKSIAHIEKIAKGTIAIAIRESDVKNSLIKIQNDEKELNDINKNNDQLYKKEKELEDSQSEYTDFMNFLNYSLASLGIHIKLFSENENYYLRHTIDEVGLSIDSISEGEKNLLALLYFYFELYEDEEQNKLKNYIKMIVIDDPITSLDDANKFYVLEIIQKILLDEDSQKFILTHSWEDFCQLTQRFKTNDKNALFEIVKNSQKYFQSEIRVCSKPVAPYRRLLQETIELSKKTEDELNNFEIYHAANSMRRVFEEFLNFKKPNLLPQKSNQSEIEDMYFKVCGKQMGGNMKIRIGALLTFINVLSHRSIKSNEVIQHSKTLVNFIKNIDSVHFHEMKL